MVILDIILRGKLGYSRVMLRDNKFNEALLQSDTGRQSRNKKATKDSLDLPFLFKETAEDSVISLLVIQWKCFLLNVFLSPFSPNMISQFYFVSIETESIPGLRFLCLWNVRKETFRSKQQFNFSQIDKLNWFVN